MRHHSRPFFLFLVLACSPLVFALDPPPAYVKQCASCHVADGTGRSSSAIGKIPDLRSKEIASLSDEQLFDTIARGNAHKAYAFISQYGRLGARTKQESRSMCGRFRGAPLKQDPLSRTRRSNFRAVETLARTRS